MVFCGRPSKGCSACRKRRIKCDQIRPACSQCLRAAKKCEGYRDQLDLSFRNENEKIASKARRQPTPQQDNLSRHQKDETYVPIYDSKDSQSQALALIQICPPTYSLQGNNPFKDYGINFFFTRVKLLVDDNPQNKPKSLVQEVIPWSDIYASDALFNAVSSVGYASLGNITQDRRYTILARKRFAVALSTVTAALKKLPGTDLEIIFKSVMLLSVFQLVSEPLGNQADWSIHVEGGAAILQLMDTKKSRDIPIRQQLKLCLSVFGKYLNKQEPCSPNILAWYKRCADSIDPDDEPAIALTQLLIELTDLNACIGQPGLRDSSAMVAKVIELEAKMELWEKEIPDAWVYRDLATTTEYDACDFRQATLHYRDLWTARIWNDYRWARISVNDLIIRNTFKRDFMLVADAAQVCKSMQINTKMAKGICNSIVCGFDSNPNAKATGNFLLLHPLAFAAGGIGVPEDVHAFAIKRLLNMGDHMGLGQALHLVDKAIIQRQEWKTILDGWVN